MLPVGQRFNRNLKSWRPRMADSFSNQYSPAIENAIRLFYDTLSEKERRRYVAVEAVKFGYGGQSYIASVVGCCRDTVASGLAELATLPDKTTENRTRRPGGSVPDRNQQFEHIEELKKRYFGEKNPVFSIDTKKKELLGMLYRKGRSYCQESFQAFDHDFPSWSSGKIVPHGIWDPTPNHGQPRSFEPWHQLGNEPVRLRQFPLVLATDRSSSLS